MSVWRAFWQELNTPDRFAAQPYYAFINQVGHMALGAVLVLTVGAVWAQATGRAPPGWPVAGGVIAVYVIAVELVRQKWVGADTLLDASFVSMGAVLAPITLRLTESGRWISVDDASGAFLVWLAGATAALAAYVYPRLVAAYGGGNDPAPDRQVPPEAAERSGAQGTNPPAPDPAIHHIKGGAQ